jgi:putative SOS response-associated peptidase YedK
MCFHAKQSKTAAQLKNRFKVRFDKEIEYEPSEVLNGFTYPKLPVITNKDASNIQLFNWGLIPSWAKDVSFRKNTIECPDGDYCRKAFISQFSAQPLFSIG